MSLEVIEDLKTTDGELSAAPLNEEPPTAALQSQASDMMPFYYKYLPDSWTRSSILPILMQPGLRDAFEPSYRIVMADTSIPMNRDHVFSFLSIVMIDTGRQILWRDVDEFMKVRVISSPSPRLVHCKRICRVLSHLFNLRLCCLERTPMHLQFP